MQYSGRLSAAAFWQHVTWFAQQLRAALADFPLYGVAGWTGPRTAAEWQFDNDRLTTVGLAYGDPTRVTVPSGCAVPSGRRRWWA